MEKKDQQRASREGQRIWFFTANPTHEGKPAVPPPEWDPQAMWFYHTVEHVGEESGLNHYHALAHFKERLTLAEVKRDFWQCGWVRVEPCKSYDDAIKYLSDGHTTVGKDKMYGTPHKKGYRTDLQHALACVRGGATAAEVRLANPSLYRMCKAIDVMVNDVVVQPPFKGIRAVVVLWGPPATGKTTRLFNRYGRSKCYVVNLDDPHMFDGYNYEENLILEDLKHMHHRLDLVKRLITTDLLEVPCRYVNKSAAWKRVLITSQWDPVGWWPEDYDRDKVLNRLSYVEWISALDTPSEKFPPIAPIGIEIVDV